MPRDSAPNTPARRLVPWRRHVMALFVLMLLWRGLIPEGFMPNFAALKALRWELVVCGPEWQAATARWQAQMAGSAGLGGAQHSHGLAGEGGPGQAAHGDLGGHGGHRSQDGAAAFSSAHAHGHESHAAQAQGMALAASAAPAAAEQGEAKAGAATDAANAGTATYAADALTLASADTAAFSDTSALADLSHHAEAHSGDTAHRAFSCAFALAALQLIDVPEVCTAPDLLRAGWVARVQATPSVLPALLWVQGPPLGSRAPPVMRALA